jgi:RNA polymerase sigma factor (sigma-70 family)
MAHPNPLGPMSDPEIIRSLQSGFADRRRAEEALFSKYAYYMGEGIKKYHLSEESAFDAYSDSVLALLSALAEGSFRGESSLKTYLYRVFNNKCVDIIRKNTTNKNAVHHTVSVTEMFQQLSDGAKSVLQQLSEQADIGLLRSRLSELGEKCRQLLMLSA